jgi:hypothetical protein
MTGFCVLNAFYDAKAELFVVNVIAPSPYLAGL